MVPGFSLADNFRPPYADNANHTFYYDQLTDSGAKATTWSRNENLDPTDINTERKWSDFHPHGDVQVFDGYYDGDWGGIYSCQDEDGLACDHAHVRYDEADQIDMKHWKHIACHEMGHSVGLGHRPASCMGSTDANTVKYLFEHDILHINGAGYQ